MLLQRLTIIALYRPPISHTRRATPLLALVLDPGRTGTAVYPGWLRKFLWVMVVLLVFQFLRMMWARL